MDASLSFEAWSEKFLMASAADNGKPASRAAMEVQEDSDLQVTSHVGIHCYYLILAYTRFLRQSTLPILVGFGYYRILDFSSLLSFTHQNSILDYLVSILNYTNPGSNHDFCSFSQLICALLISDSNKIFFIVSLFLMILVYLVWGLPNEKSHGIHSSHECWFSPSQLEITRAPTDPQHGVPKKQFGWQCFSWPSLCPRAPGRTL
jgi:hypothetical protein